MAALVGLVAVGAVALAALCTVVWLLAQVS
jgi:hypothetical protein